MRRVTNKELSDSVRQTIWKDVVSYCMAVFGFGLCCYVLAYDESVFDTYCAIIFGMTMVLIPSWWYLRIAPLRHQKKYHYKCSKCADTWDE